MADSVDPDRDAAERLQLIAAGLAATGLSTRLHETPAGTDLAATLHPAGQREMEVVVDEDGYTEIRYWANPKATPHQAVSTIALVLCAITTIEGLQASSETAGGADGAGDGYDGPITRRAGEHGMSGSGDQLAGYERSPDPARPREQDNPRDSRSQPTDLQARLERLPVGHPSSPYRGDGTRKPPPPDLRDYELDLPDEQPADPDPPDQDLPAEDRPVISSDGSWDWRGRKLEPELSHAIDQTAARCREAEKHLTPAMRGLEARLEHGQLVSDTDKFALKDPDRFKEKLAKLKERFPDTDPIELLNGIADGVRYTFIFDNEHYTESVETAQPLLEDAGYDHVETRPGWNGDEYKGVNSRWREPSAGVLFEVQFHTQESWDAKQKTHDAYEEIDTLDTPVEDVERLRAYQREISAAVRIPQGALEIQPYKKGR